MEIRLIADDGVHECPVDELPNLLARDDGLVWVDIPSCDEDAQRVLADLLPRLAER